MKNRKTKNDKYNDMSARRRTRLLQIIFAALCIMVVLSMVLAAVSR